MASQRSKTASEESLRSLAGPDGAACFSCSQWGGEQEQGVRKSPCQGGSHKSGPFCPLHPQSHQGPEDPNSLGLIHQVAP